MKTETVTVRDGGEKEEGGVVKTPACRTSTDRQHLSMDKLTSSNSDPTLAVTSSIPVPCAAVSFPAIMLSLSRRWVRGLARRTLEVRKRGREGGETNKQEPANCVTELVYKTGNLPQKPGLRRLGWSIFFFSSAVAVHLRGVALQ